MKVNKTFENCNSKLKNLINFDQNFKTGWNLLHIETLTSNTGRLGWLDLEVFQVMSSDDFAGFRSLSNLVKTHKNALEIIKSPIT